MVDDMQNVPRHSEMAARERARQPTGAALARANAGSDRKGSDREARRRV